MHNYWILLPILGAVGYSLSRFIRNFLIDTEFQRRDVSALATMTAGSYIIIMVLLFAVFGPEVFNLPMGIIVGMFASGALTVLSQFPQFKALKIAETVEVTIFSQCAPLIALIFGLIFLRQSINGQQLLGFGMIMLAAGILVFAQNNKRTQKLKMRTAGLVLASSAMWIMADIVFTACLGESRELNVVEFAKYFMYFEMGSLITIAVLTIFRPSWQKTLKKVFFTKRKGKNLIISLINNIVFAGAETLYKIALMMTPAVALLSVIDQVSGLIVTFILGIVLSLFYPKLGREKLTKQILVRHLLAAVLVGAGIILVS